MRSDIDNALNWRKKSIPTHISVWNCIAVRVTFVIFIRLRAAGNGTPRGDSAPPASHRLNTESPLIGRSPLQIDTGWKQMNPCYYWPSIGNQDSKFGTGTLGFDYWLCSYTRMIELDRVWINSDTLSVTEKAVWRFADGWNCIGEFKFSTVQQYW